MACTRLHRPGIHYERYKWYFIVTEIYMAKEVGLVKYVLASGISSERVPPRYYLLSWETGVSKNPS
jgi:hypothetical protein